ncbi:MAG: amino acid/amide transporter ATP-binding protein 2, family [Paenibacillus sp.]|nr:amino acid/amide transporter ATP-binding protein 2, family [Paenibacillus sp.]
MNDAHANMEKGLIHVPEGRRVFAALTVTENLELGVYQKRQQNQDGAKNRHGFRHVPPLSGASQANGGIR